MVLGKLPRVNRRVGFVVLRKFAAMLRRSAAFSNSSFPAAVRISFSSAVIHSPIAFQELAGLRNALAVLLGAVSLKRTGTW